MILGKNLKHIKGKIENTFSVEISSYSVDSKNNDDFSEFISNSVNPRKNDAIAVCSLSLRFKNKQSPDLSNILYRFEYEQMNNIKNFIRKEFGGGNYEILEIGNYSIIYYLIDRESRIL